MKINLHLSLFLLIFISCKNEPKAPANSVASSTSSEWIELYNGKDFTGWKAATEHDSTWTIADGVMQAFGDRCHLFYTGDQLKDGFKNFELIAQIKTHKLANSGIYFHTQYQAEGWPSKGFEIQVNNSHIGGGDYIEFKKTGSLYSVRNIYQTFTPDSVWYETRALVEGKHVQIWVDGMKIVDYIEPENPLMHGLDSAHIIGMGTFALQGHDVKSKTQYKSIKVRRLPDDAGKDVGPAPVMMPWYDTMKVLQGRQFAFIDLNTHSTLSIDSLMSDYYGYGINVSVLKAPSSAGELSSLSKQPVFKGLLVNTKDIKEINPATKSDYTIGVSTTLKEATELLNSGKINIWSHHGEPLTAKNTGALIALAKKNNIAIEIDNEAKTPSMDVIAMAKSKGCRFTFANLVPSSKLEKSTYVFDVIKDIKLAYKDEWVPKM
ncbi:MAG: family 16 glycoside hydrolase [Saprospiraceae bacterium]